MKKIIVLAFTLLQLQLSAQKNIALQAKIIDSKNINNTSYLIDGKVSHTKECQYNYSEITFDLNLVHKISSIEIFFSQNRTCDNWIKNLSILAGNGKDKLRLLEVFGEKHFTKKIICQKEVEAQFIKIEINALEDCSEGEFLCIEEIKIF